MSMIYRNGGSLQLEGAGSGGMASGSFEGDEDYIKQMKELHAYLDMVKNMIRPGCPEEALKLALNSMSSLFSALNFMSSMPRPHASL